MERENNPTQEQLQASTRPEKSNFCSLVLATMFSPRIPSNQKNISKIDQTLEKLYEQQLAGQTKLGQLKVDLGKLSDKKNKIDPRGLPRATLVAQTRKKMSALLHQDKQYQKNIDFFVACKMNLENNAMTREMATNIKVLKKEMIKVGAINVESLQDDVDDIAEMNADIQDVNNLVSDTMVNAWEMDLDGAEDELEAYLAEDLSDIEEDGEVNYIKPLIDPLRRKNAEREALRRREDEEAITELQGEHLPQISEVISEADRVDENDELIPVHNF